MSRRPLLGVAFAVASTCAAVALVMVVRSPTGDGGTGARVIGGGGDVLPGLVDAGRTVALDEVNLGTGDTEGSGWMIRSDGRDGFWVLVESTLLHARRRQVDDVRRVVDDPVTRFAVGPDGEIAGYVLGSDTVHLLGPGPDGDVDSGAAVEAVAFTSDGTLLVAAANAIRAFPVTGEPHVLVGTSDHPDAEIRVDQPLGSIRLLAPLDDGRLAFTTDDPAAERTRLHLVDAGTHRSVDLRYANNGGRTMYDLTPAPDGRLLAVVSVPGQDLASDGSAAPPVVGVRKQVALIDPDSGEAEIIADVADVDPEGNYVSVAAVGDDLVFLADGRIWELESAFRR